MATPALETTEQLAVEAAAFARVLAPDMPGFGQASKPADFNYTVEGYAACLDALMKPRRIRRAHLVLEDSGHSPFADNPQRVAPRPSCRSCAASARGGNGK